jgi:hypothetical protein
MTSPPLARCDEKFVARDSPGVSTENSGEWEVEGVGYRMNWVVLHSGKDVESCLFKPQAEAAYPAEQIDRGEPATRR